MQLKQIAALCGGTVIGNGEREITGFFTDSRQATPTTMFVPIKGETVDGHGFIPQVQAVGAASFSEAPIRTGDAVRVPNAIAALQALGLAHRQQLAIPIVGITGSVGKTTAKEMVALALGAGKQCFRTKGNANSQIGVPLTLLQITPQDEIAVIEMGMSLPGEMGRIASTVRPNMAVFTNVGVSHIEFHGTREKIMEQKLHITDYFTNQSTLLVNGDDDLLCTLKGNTPYQTVTFGLTPNCDWLGTNLQETEDATSFICSCPLGEFAVAVPVPGKHNVRNALCALAVAATAGVPVAAAAQALATYTPPSMRQQIHRMGKLTIIDDSYNASPDSTVGALEILAGMQATCKIALLADMLELGDYAQQGHTQVGQRARELGVTCLIAFGQQAAAIATGYGQGAQHFTKYEEAFAYLKAAINENTAVLVKGSRGMQTDRFVQALLQEERWIL